MTELTEKGAEFLDDLVASYQSILRNNRDMADARERNRNDILGMLDENDLETASPLHQYVVKLPHEHEEYGFLLEGEGDYIAKCRYHLKNNQSVNQGRREPKVALEAELRDQEDLFAEIIGWDSSEFSWTVMEEVEPRKLRRRDMKPLLDDYREVGWDPKDAEYGENHEGDIVCLDYGYFDRDEWKVSPDSLLESERAF